MLQCNGALSQGRTIYNSGSNDGVLALCHFYAGTRHAA